MEIFRRSSTHEETRPFPIESHLPNCQSGLNFKAVARSENNREAEKEYFHRLFYVILEICELLMYLRGIEL